MSFLEVCSTSGADSIDLWSETGYAQRFRIHPVRSISPIAHKTGSEFSCPDPFVWKPLESANYLIQCTGGGIHIGVSSDLEPDSGSFSFIGDSLGGEPASWAAATAFDSR